MNPKAGVLLCLTNFSPKWYIDEGLTEGPAPPLQKFSDILWFQWLDAAGDNVRNVKYFYRHHVSDEDSEAVLNAIEAMPNVCQSLTDDCALLTFPKQSLLPFPGRTYSMDGGKSSVLDHCSRPLTS